MKILDTVIDKRGFIYTQLHNEGGYFLYEQRLQETGQIIGYEVFKRKVLPERSLGGKILPCCEVFPPNSAFGSWAWSFYTLESAMEKLVSLTKPKRDAEAI